MLSSLLFLSLLGTVVRAVPNANNTYEYIVVGSGPGGGGLAVNLAKAGHSVLLIEAGDDQTTNKNYTDLFNFELAGNDEKTRWDFFVRHTEKDDFDYKYMTYRKPDGSFYVGLNPPANATKLGVYYPRTGTLGGCAMHNAGVDTIPAEADWDYIANITGDSSWTGKNMRKHFISLEDNQSLPKNDTTHGFKGYLKTRNGDPSWAIADGIDVAIMGHVLMNMTGNKPSDLQAMLSRDINSADPGRDNQLGLFGDWRHADKDNIRSTGAYYILDTLKDPKVPLKLQLNTLVTKVLFDNSSTPRATGVNYLQGKYLYQADPRYDPKVKGTPGTAWATKEVIISGGTFNSPQILKLSGIGPADELKKFNIPVVVDSPGVGSHLADNYEGSVMSLAARELKGQGGIGFHFLKTAQAEGRRDIQMWCGAFSFEGYWPGFPINYGLKQYECAFVHMNPRSQEGVVMLRSADPTDTPDINFKFWEKNADQDLAALVEAAKWARNVLKGVPASSGLTPFTELHPCDKANCTDEETKHSMRKQVYSHHATSTCAIGGEKDKWAVLDSKFRVRGVKGLRVVDASAFPKVPGAFPVIPTFMLSQKATEDILAAA